MQVPKLQFHTIDALRFFAFLKVFIFHFQYDLNNPVIKFLKQGGGIGVAFFFVLSGFLITYILVNEKIHTGKINTKSFFLRRILRIWPVYFFLLLLLYLLPAGLMSKIGFIGYGYQCDWWYSFSFTENYRMIYLDDMPGFTPLGVIWSLCIEEHFYLVWFFVVSFLPVKKLPVAFLSTFVVAIVSRILYGIYIPNIYILTNDLFTNFDFFGAGAVLGYYTVTKYEWLTNKINSIPVYLKASYLIFVVTFIIFIKYFFDATKSADFLHPTILAILFALTIAIFIPENSRLRINNKNILSYLGRISYGLYMYHSMVLIFLAVVFGALGFEINSFLSISAAFVIMLALTILASSLSYHLMETQILKLKNKFFNK